MNPPKVGDIIYVPSELYLSHGADDKVGGKAVVNAVIEDSDYIWVEVSVFPGTRYSWKFLAEQQDALEKQFGETWAHPDPDYSPESNMWD